MGTLGSSVQTDVVSAGLSSSGVFDAQGKEGALPAAIKRIHGHGTVAGPATTVACAEGSVSGVLSALAESQQGQVLIIQGAGEWAYFGELTGAEALRVGIVAVVLDTYVRDIDRLSEWDIQVFARGVTPKGAGFGALGEVGVPLTIGEAVIEPGDWLVGDGDGLVTVPSAQAQAVFERARELVASEGQCAARVLSGDSLLNQDFRYGKTFRETLSGFQEALLGGSATK
jgi:4-hydroxy-4-methyl-2-oxoglutarate aldolase